MTISTTASSVTIGGNGATTAFNFPFIAGAASNVVVTYTDANSNATTLLQGSQYTLAINPAAAGQIWGVGGTVTYPLSGSPIAAGSYLTIQRIVPFTQLTSISNQGDFYPQAVERAFDTLEMQIQQGQFQTGRALLFNIADQGPFGTLPISSVRAGKILGFDSSGNPGAYTQLPFGSVSSAMAPVVLASTIALAQSLLGIVTSAAPVVANIAALRANVLPFQTIVVSGYHAGADGGEGVFWYNASDITSTDNGGTIIVDGSGRRWYRETGSLALSVKWFGATGNGTTDDTTAINAALAIGGPIWVPAGTYKTTDSLVVSVSGTHVSGAGEGATVIAPSSTTSDVWLVSNSIGMEFCSIRNFTIAPSAVQTAGAAIHQSGLANIIQYSGIRITRGYIGFFIETTTGVVARISDFYIQSCTSVGILLGSSTGLVQDAFISNGNISTCFVGIQFINVSGAYLSKIDVVEATTAGIAIQPPSGLEAFALFFDQVLADTTTAGAGWAIGGAGKCVNIICTNCWAAASASNGITISTPTLNGFTWSAGHIRNNANHGILISGGCTAVSINGGTQIFNNGYSSPGTYNGISVAGGQTYFQIVGVMAGTGGLDQEAGGVNAQNYGIAVAAGASNVYVISNNVCVGNLTAGVYDGGTGSNKFVGNNVP